MRVLTLCVVLVAGAATAAPVPKKQADPVYFPAAVGDAREYEWRTGDKAEAAYSDAVTQVAPQKDGATHVTLRRTNLKGDASTTIVAVSATGLRRVADGDRVLAEPVVLLKLPAKVGTAWDEGGSKYEVTATEEVKVAAGTYKAVKVERSSDGAKTTLWFAPTVGLVRMTAGGRTLELKSFKPGK